MSMMTYEWAQNFVYSAARLDMAAARIDEHGFVADPAAMTRHAEAAAELLGGTNSTALERWRDLIQSDVIDAFRGALELGAQDSAASQDALLGVRTDAGLIASGLRAIATAP